jgi:hypothetical protein
MSSITFEDCYKQYSLYNGSKNEKGFYLSILDKIDCIFNDALANFAKPTIAHIIIDNPKNYRINQVLSRIIANEANIRGIDIPNFYYISVIERRRKNSNFHQHLAIILDKADYYFFELIKLKLRRFSNSGKVTLAKRKHDSRPDYIDPETGEIKKQGSAYLHNLRKETFDAFQRISYIAKVETKITPKFSSSRILSHQSSID